MEGDRAVYQGGAAAAAGACLCRRYGLRGVLGGFRVEAVDGCRVITDTGDAAYELARSTGNYSWWQLALIRFVEHVALYRVDGVIVRGSFHRDLLRREGVRRVEFVPDGARAVEIGPRGKEKSAKFCAPSAGSMKAWWWEWSGDDLVRASPDVLWLGCGRSNGPLGRRECAGAAGGRWGLAARAWRNARGLWEYSDRDQVRGPGRIRRFAALSPGDGCLRFHPVQRYAGMGADDG